MKDNVILTVTSLLSIVFIMFHVTDEIARGMEPGGLNHVLPVLVLVLWLYGTLVLAGRPAGYIIILLGSIIGSGVPVLHMTGAGLVGRRIANTGGILFWVWTNYALAVTATFSLVLSARALWTRRWRRQPESR